MTPVSDPPAPSPPWGAAARAHWALAPDVAYLNHGGFGLTPLVVLAEQDRWRARIESNPTRFLGCEIEEALRAAVRPVAEAVGASAEDLVFVENATAGLNAVLRALDFEPGDEILITSLSYPAIRKAAHYAASRSGVRVVEVALRLPLATDGEVLRAVAARLGFRTKLAIFDHIASHSALILPVAALTRLAHEAGARVLIDGAHAPGMIALDIPAIGAEWYVGNLHKWYFAPRSCGFLWAAKPAQALIHPLAISHGYGDGFQAEFEWTGTRDVTAALAAPAALAFHRQLGGTALMDRNVAMARAAAMRLSRLWRSEISGPPEAFGAMATIRLPLSGQADAARLAALTRDVSERHRIEAAFVALEGAAWVRIAVQAYNADEEYDRLGAILRAAS
ncbi:MAG TPA: aminotransferase class V-fold PLP-dependent enzyme [Stellaceae bacterium]|nr:aminotransferase class V-fold PLP-dependent enzyme [Stellaceae bacterium]